VEFDVIPRGGRVQKFCCSCHCSLYHYHLNPEPVKKRRRERYKRNPKSAEIERRRSRKYNKEHYSESYKYACEWRLKHPRMTVAWAAEMAMKLFLEKLGYSRDYNVRQVVGNRKISNKLLESLTRGGGWPDWRKECVEEKRLRDFIQVTQWARSILEYRAGREYKVAFRLNRFKSKLFNTVFEFYDWLQEQGQAERLSV
jgi:hypothetical protein